MTSTGSFLICVSSPASSKSGNSRARRRAQAFQWCSSFRDAAHFNPFLTSGHFFSVLKSSMQARISNSSFRKSIG
uniref:Uncharacterized protein n=1 Tax=Trichogramma kaykai TaxID=54128 RepID=A0ABD2WR80_9HYME